MQGEIYQVFTGYAKLDGIIWQLAAAWRHWHEQRAGKEDCLTVLYRKLRPPFTGCFLTTQTTRSDQRLSCQVLSSEEAATNAQGKGTGQGTASSPPRPSQPFGKGLLTLLKVFVLPLPWIIKLKKKLEVHLHYHDSSKNYRCDYFKSWAPSLQNLNRDEHSRLTSYYQQHSFLCHTLQENVVINKTSI